MRSAQGVLRAELALLVGAATVAIFALFGGSWLADLSDSLWAGFLFGWLFAVMMWLSFGVVRHADCLAIKLGEPYGTLILTLAVIGIEVIMISAFMITGGENPTLARDTMFSILMIVLNGMLGATLLLGGLRHHEQVYNLEGAKTYLGVIIPVAVLALILPRFTESAPGGEAGPAMALFLVVMCVGLYGVFLSIQTMRHSHFFRQPADGEIVLPDHDEHEFTVRSMRFHAAFLVLSMLPIVLLSKSMAMLVDHGISSLEAPHALGGLLIALLVLSPEGLSATRAALNNQLQRTVNIALGSSLSTICLTIPAVLLISMLTGKRVELGIEPTDIVLLVLTLLVAMVNFGGGRTNVLHGAVHLILFLAYIILIFD